MPSERYIPHPPESLDNYDVAFRRSILEKRYDLSEPEIKFLESKIPYLFSQNNLEKKEFWLQQVGFPQPVEILKICPMALVRYPTLKSVTFHLSGLEALGINQPIKTISENSRLLDLTLPEVKGLLKDLKQSGKIKNPINMINHHGKSIDIPMENFNCSVNFLTKLGFSNPSRVVEENPGVARMSPKQIIQLISTIGRHHNLSPQEILNGYTFLLGKRDNFIKLFTGFVQRLDKQPPADQASDEKQKQDQKIIISHVLKMYLADSTYEETLLTLNQSALFLAIITRPSESVDDLITRVKHITKF